MKNFEKALSLIRDNKSINTILEEYYYDYDEACEPMPDEACEPMPFNACDIDKKHEQEQLNNVIEYANNMQQKLSLFLENYKKEQYHKAINLGRDVLIDLEQSSGLLSTLMYYANIYMKEMSND